MRGLAFPSNPPADRETSYEYGTPNAQGDDIPIDPTLGIAAIDPALMGHPGGANDILVQPENPYFQPQSTPLVDYARARQYSQGPQGDPFAPQPVESYFPIEPEPPGPPPKPRRRRKIRREEECSFCQGNDARNKVGQQELMVTCSECGRSGHPSCMQLTDIGDHMRNYPWKCMECKNCEICHEKGDDERILFCDWCDRGWHLDCMVPPMTEAPEGKWHCPMCPPPPPPGHVYYDYPEMQAEDANYMSRHVREASVASSSRSLIGPGKSARSRGNASGKGKTKARSNAFLELTQIHQEEEEESDIDVEVEETPAVARSRTKTKMNKINRPRRAKKEEEEEEEEPLPISPPRQLKRKRGREPSTPLLPRVRLRLPTYRGKGKEREEEEGPSGLFDDILGVDDRDTTKTTVTNSDKQYFEKSRVIAETKLAPPPPPPGSGSRISEAPDAFAAGPSRPLRSSMHHQVTLPASATGEPSASPVPSTPGGPMNKMDPAVLRIRTIRFGKFDIKTWYDAPFPEEYASIPDGRLWICEFCLKYMKSRFGAARHQMKCKSRHPPGDEIYRDGAVSIFEVDGRRNKIYCQNLCLLSKMFLDHKSLFYDVEPFLFYVITEVDDFGARFVGYFSKEKRSPKDYNVSCIMTLPVRQRQGWGNLLIDFSYLLSKKEQRTGSPEKPLSSLGALGYRNYWTLSIMRYLATAPSHIRLEDISTATSMTLEDICETLVQQSMIYIREATPPLIKPSPGQSIKFPKGRKNGIARRQLPRMQTQDKDPEGPKGPFVAPKHYEIRWNHDVVDNYMKTWEAKGYLRLKPEKLHWSPYLISRKKAEAEPAVELSALVGTAESSVVPSQASATPIAEFAVDNDLIVEEGMKEDSPNVEPNDTAVQEIAEPARAVRETRSHTQSPLKKATKVESPVELSPELDASPMRRLRSRSSQASSSALAEIIEEPRVTRARTGRYSAVANQDEAFAAQLAMEERRQGGRQLRSRDSEAPKKSIPAPPTSRGAPIRKRRRVDSSPEMDETLHHLEDDVSPNEAKTSNGVRSNGDHDYLANEMSHGDDNKLTSLPPESVDAFKFEELSNGDFTEVKPEDMGTVLGRRPNESTEGIYSTHFMHIHLQSKHGNGLGGIRNGHAESDIRSTLDYVKGPLIEEGDEDADGEYEEEDADGEPDPEVYEEYN